MESATLPVTTECTGVPVSRNIITDYPDSCVFLSAVSCSLSILGAIGIFVTYGKLPEIRNVTRKMIICLTVADLLTASGVLVSVYRYFRVPTGSGTINQLPVLCKVQSVISTYSSLVSFFLTVFIGIHLAYTVINQQGCTGTTKALVLFNVISWTVPAVVVGVAYGKGVLGEDRSGTGGTGPWCWIDTNAKHRIWWMVATGKGWEVACYLLTISIYVLMKFYLYLRHRGTVWHEIHPSLRNEDKNVLYLWFVLYAVRIWGTLRFLIYWINPLVSKKAVGMVALLYMQAAGDPAQAFCNFLIFCVFDSTVHKKIKMRFVSGFRISRDRYNRLPENRENEPIGEGTAHDSLITVTQPTYDSTVDNDTWKHSGQGPRRTPSELNLFS